MTVEILRLGVLAHSAMYYLSATTNICMAYAIDQDVTCEVYSFCTSKKVRVKSATEFFRWNLNKTVISHQVLFPRG